MQCYLSHAISFHGSIHSKMSWSSSRAPGEQGSPASLAHSGPMSRVRHTKRPQRCESFGEFLQTDGWFIIENPKIPLKWMIWGSPILGKPHLASAEVANLESPARLGHVVFNHVCPVWISKLSKCPDVLANTIPPPDPLPASSENWSAACSILAGRNQSQVELYISSPKKDSGFHPDLSSRQV
jgi:hypothetical protein